MIAGQDILAGTNIEIDPNDGKAYPGYRDGIWITPIDLKAGDEIPLTMKDVNPPRIIEGPCKPARQSR